MSRRIVTTAAVLLIAVSCSDGDGDPSDIVTWQGREYVVMWSCPSVDPALLGDVSRARLDPAISGAEDVDVRARSIRRLDPDVVIAVQGPEDVLCPDTDQAGFGVAFASTVSHAQVERRLERLPPG